jgi:PAS domain S-box-containing protein
VAKGSPREAALVPIAWPGHSHASGVLIAGVNPFRPFDAEYRGFLSLLAGQISTGLSSVRASDEERRREKALMASIVENSDDAIVSKTLDGVITSWNAGAQRLFGYSAEEAVGQSVLMLIPPERHGEEATILDRMRRGERIENFETVRIGKDGRLLDVSITVSPMRDKTGRLSGASKVARDIGGRKRAEEALRQSEARLRTILSLLPTGVCACDERGRITFFNQRATELCGRAPMAGSRNFDFPGIRTSDGRLCSPEQSPMAEAVRSGRSCRDVEVFMERADGTRFPALVNVAPIFDDTGRIRGAIIVFQDISLQVETRELLRRQQQILEEAVARRTAELQESHQRLRLSERMASLGTLSAGLGHDMANLLIPVRVSLDALGSAPLSDELRADVERISTSARYLQQLATGLRMMALDPSKGAMAERLHLSSWWSDAGAIVKNSLPRGVSVRVDIPDDVWVRMSRPALTQVVFNLVQNAGDALKERSDPVIRIVARRAEDRVVVSVEDNGAGMSEEVQRRCMEPFFTTKTRGISTGLGLVLVGGLVRDAGGTVSIASEAGHGTRFDLDLPSGGDSVRGSDWKRSLIRARVKIGDARLRAFAVDQLGVLQVDVVDGEGGTCDLAVVEGAAESPDGYEGARRVIVLGGDKVASGSVTVLSSRPRPSEFRSALHGAVRELSVDGAGS